MENLRKQTSSEIIGKALQTQYLGMSEQNKKIVTREMLFAPQNRMIEIDEERKMGAEDLRFMVANTLETPVKDDLNVRYAQSIENINSGIDPVAEYFSWLNETTAIMHDLNDGFVSKEDALKRESFLELTDQREADLMVCLGLYESCKSKEAEERARFIRYKLQKLREMRSAIKSSTSDKQDIVTTSSEYDYVKPYYQYFKKLNNLPFGYDISDEKKKSLKIRFTNCEEVKEDYNHFADLLNEALDEMKREDEARASFIEKGRNASENSEENKYFARR